MLDAKTRFERDRSYARKFVLSEEDLEAFIDAPVAEASDADPSTNILAIWASKFRAIGAEEAVFSDDDLPTKIKSIENAAASRAPKKALKPVKTTPRCFHLLNTLNCRISDVRQA